MKLISRLLTAAAFGVAATVFANYDAPPARIMILIGVSVIAFIALPGSKEKPDK